MTFAVPEYVSAVTDRLRERGFQAYLVGGCVRDTLRGVTPNDYDVATSALPEETVAAFPDPRVIGTGMRHGTVTVLSGGRPIEVTTFRVDGPYRDHRRPDAVAFTPSLEEDLARRDFTVNAMAWGKEGLVDPFGGQEALARRVIACVGEPARRFDEDGLRILRAVRFAATLDFTVDPATAADVHNSTSLLDPVSAERKWAELTKWLCGPAAARVLAEYRDLIEHMIPELRGRALDRRLLASLPPRKELRLAALFSSLPAEEAGAILARFKCDGATRKRVLAALSHKDAPLGTEGERLRLVHAVGWPAAGDVAALQGNAEAAAFLRRAEKDGAPVALADLAVTGDDLAALGAPGGRRMGVLLDTLLLRVIDGQTKNERSALLAAAREMIEQWRS